MGDEPQTPQSPQMSLAYLAKHLAPEVAKHIKPRNVYGRNDFTPEEVNDLKMSLRVLKWCAGVLGVCSLGIIGMLVTMVLAYGDLQHVKEDALATKQETKGDIKEVQNTVNSMQNSNAAMQASQSDLVKKVDGFGRLIENLDRRVASHNKQDDETP